MAKNTVSETERMVVTRVFDAPRELVWKAWTDPKYVMQWWGPKGFITPFCKMDFRVGGKFLCCMRDPDGQEFWNAGEYHEIVPHEKIVSSMYFSDAQGNKVEPAHYGIEHEAIDGVHDVTTFEDLGNGQTRLTFIGNEGESRLAVSKILKGSHIVHTVYGLMLYSIVRRLNLVSLRVGKVHGGNDLFVRNNLVVFTGIPELLAIRSSHAAEKLSSHAKIHLAKRRGKTLRAPPLHHILRVRPRLPNQFAWGIENSRDNHPLCLANRVFCHL